MTAESAIIAKAPYYYYVVIGVFGYHNNAKRYTNFANELGLKTDYAYHPTRNLYYVYIYLSKDKSKSVRVTLETRKNKKYVNAHEMFEDTWVFGTDELEKLSYNLPKPEIPLAGYVENPEEVLEQEDIESVRVVEDEPHDGTEDQANAAGAAGANVSQEGENADTKPVRREGYYPIYINAYNGTNLKEVQTTIDVKDVARSKIATRLKSHNLTEIVSPNRTGEVELISEMFGYRTLQHQINLKDPKSGEGGAFVEMFGDTIVVDFELVRYRVGDLVTMYNVYFFKDAAVIRPESKKEMNDLLEMLQENPNYKIKIHGHTNGSASGPIITPEDEEDNLFNINGNVKRGSGSAKKLSQERADIMKRWLAQNGIAEDRIETKGWGGARKLYDTKGSNADKNVRVEVEILTE